MCEVSRRHYEDNTNVSETARKCQGHQSAVKISSDLLETLKFGSDTRYLRGHQGHQRPVNDTRDVFDLLQSCFVCVHQVHSL